MALDRRQFLAAAGGGIAAATVLSSTTADGAPSEPTGLLPTTIAEPQVPSSATSFRPPAVPLVVRSPYLHSWLPGEVLAGSWAMRWNGQETQLCGLVRVDGAPFVWAGRPHVAGAPMARLAQRGLAVTPTRSVFTMEGAGLRLVAEFLNPVEPGNPRLQSAPLSLLTVTVWATDGRAHEVSVYADIAGQWASGRTSDVVRWATTRAPFGRCWTLGLEREEVFAEHEEMAAWGSVLFGTTPISSAVSFESGWEQEVRYRFAAEGGLSSRVDPRFRAIDEDLPVVALAHRLGRVGPGGAACRFVLGELRQPAIEYLREGLQPAWVKYWAGSWERMFDDFLSDGPAARNRAVRLDERIMAAASRVGGTGYAQLCALAVPQTYGACELVSGPQGQTWGFLKEIGSGDATSTVDTITAASPLWLHLDPGYLAMLLEPVLHYASTSHWTFPWAPHDLGYFYPTANGHTAKSEQMPVQETGGLLSLAEAYAQRVRPKTAIAFLESYKGLWSGWVDWLVKQLPSPPSQLTCDDFVGPLKHCVNLALLGIVGVGAAGRIFSQLGEPGLAKHWTDSSRSLMARWHALSMDKSGAHLDLTQGNEGSWGTLYNAYLDRLIGTNLVSATLTATQAAWYTRRLERYGLPFESEVPHWARAAWESWTAAWLRHYPISKRLIDDMAKYVRTTPQRVPFSDTYWTTTGHQVLVWPVFDQARPVVGGVFALLTLA